MRGGAGRRARARRERGGRARRSAPRRRPGRARPRRPGAPLSFPSFRLAWAGDRLAASDAAAAAAALLDAGGAGAADAAAAAAARRAAFWRAWNALAAGQRARAAGGDLAAGLDAARALARAVLADGGAVLARRALRESAAGRFRWADLSRGGGLAHRDLLGTPPGLARLAAFLRDAAAARRAGRPRARRAVVLVGPPRGADGACPVVAVAAGGDGGAPPPGNTFGALFRRAAAAVGATLGDDGFDGAHVWLPGDAVERFVRELTVAAAGAELAAAAGALAVE